MELQRSGVRFRARGRHDFIRAGVGEHVGESAGLVAEFVVELAFVLEPVCSEAVVVAFVADAEGIVDEFV